MKKNASLYLLGAVLLLAFAGFSLSSFKETLTPYVSYEQAREGDRDRAGGRRPGEGELQLRRRRGVALLHPQGARDQGDPAGALQGPEAGQLRGRHQHRGHRPLRRRAPRSSRPTSSWSSAPASTRAPRSRRTARPRGGLADDGLTSPSSTCPARSPSGARCSSPSRRSWGYVAVLARRTTAASLPLRAARLRLLRAVDRALPRWCWCCCC